jgi:hypothetical protein
LNWLEERTRSVLAQVYFIEISECVLLVACRSVAEIKNAWIEGFAYVAFDDPDVNGKDSSAIAMRAKSERGAKPSAVEGRRSTVRALTIASIV